MIYGSSPAKRFSWTRKGKEELDGHHSTYATAIGSAFSKSTPFPTKARESGLIVAKAISITDSTLLLRSSDAHSTR